MKKSILLGLTCLMSVMTQAQDFYAVTPSGHRLYYSITSATEHTVSVVDPVNAPYEERQFYNNQFFGHDVDLIIPDTAYNGGVAYRVTGIGSQALNVPMHSLTVPRSMHTIGYYAFGSISESSNTRNSMRVLHFNADSLEYSGGLLEAYNNWMAAFQDCKRLDTVFIGNHVKYLPKYIFTHCDSLRCVVMGDSVHTIDTSAFGFCLRLDSIRISPALRWIGEGALYQSAIQHIELPDGLRHIGGGAFTNCLNLTEIIIPHTVDTIGTNCFFNCQHLQRVRLSNNLRRLPDDCFVNCTALSDIDFGTGLQVIGGRAFYQCQSLSAPVLPASLDTLKNGCFWGCTLASITSNSTVPPVMRGSVFPAYGQSFDIPVYIPCGTYAAYHEASTWSRFTNLMEMMSEYTLTVLSDDESMGSVEVTNPVTCSDPAVITALPAEGFRFVSWNDGNTVNPRTIMLTSDTSFTALFAADTTTVGIGTIIPDGITVSVVDRRVIVSGTTLPVNIYDIMGRREQKNSPLQPGVYLVRIGTTTRKIIVF